MRVDNTRSRYLGTTRRHSHAMKESKREAMEKLAESGAECQKRAKNKGKEKRQARQPAVY
jgi:hypothetical protein